MMLFSSLVQPSSSSALCVLCGCCFLLGWMFSAGVDQVLSNRKQVKFMHALNQILKVKYGIDMDEIEEVPVILPIAPARRA